jgi:hypothetical protein
VARGVGGRRRAATGEGFGGDIPRYRGDGPCGRRPAQRRQRRDGVLRPALRALSGRDFSSGTPMTEGVSLYATASRRTRRGATCRRRGPRRAALPRAAPARPLLPALAVGEERRPQLRHTRLGDARVAQRDDPARGLLNHYGPEHDTFRPHETVELICETVSLQDMTNITRAHQVTRSRSPSSTSRGWF